MSGLDLSGQERPAATGARSRGQERPAPPDESAGQGGPGVIGLKWTGTSLRVLNQTLLPNQTEWVTCTRAAEVADCIITMKVRGAPAIAAAAAYGIALEAMHTLERAPDPSSFVDVDADFSRSVLSSLELLAKTRPTAVNLFWAIDRIRRTLEECITSQATVKTAAHTLVELAVTMATEDVRVNRSIGSHGADLFRGPVSVLTHCNTGSLATVEYGTALGIIRSLHERNWLNHVYVDETRPFLQGARLTAFELVSEGIEHTLITDSMAGYVMQTGKVDAVLVGADRIAANGDTANKIGTYSLAVLCQFHGIPFYVAAPTSTFDLNTKSGADIPIEYRDEREVAEWLGVRSAPAQTGSLNPAFDVTPASLIEAIVTEHGVIHLPDTERIKHAMEGWQ